MSSCCAGSQIAPGNAFYKVESITSTSVQIQSGMHMSLTVRKRILPCSGEWHCCPFTLLLFPPRVAILNYPFVMFACVRGVRNCVMIVHIAANFLHTRSCQRVQHRKENRLWQRLKIELQGVSKLALRPRWHTSCFQFSTNVRTMNAHSHLL